MTFEEWWNRQMVAEWWEKQTMWPSEYNTAKAAWQAAQEAEREKVVKNVYIEAIDGYYGLGPDNVELPDGRYKLTLIGEDDDV